MVVPIERDRSGEIRYSTSIEDGEFTFVVHNENYESIANKPREGVNVNYSFHIPRN